MKTRRMSKKTAGEMSPLEARYVTFDEKPPQAVGRDDERPSRRYEAVYVTKDMVKVTQLTNSYFKPDEKWWKTSLEGILGEERRYWHSPRKSNQLIASFKSGMLRIYNVHKSRIRDVTAEASTGVFCKATKSIFIREVIKKAKELLGHEPREDWDRCTLQMIAFPLLNKYAPAEEADSRPDPYARRRQVMAIPRGIDKVLRQESLEEAARIVFGEGGPVYAGWIRAWIEDLRLDKIKIALALKGIIPATRVVDLEFPEPDASRDLAHMSPKTLHRLLKMLEPEAAARLVAQYDHGALPIIAGNLRALRGLKNLQYDRNLKSWSDFERVVNALERAAVAGDTPVRMTKAAKDLDGRRVAGYTVKVPKTTQEIRGACIECAETRVDQRIRTALQGCGGNVVFTLLKGEEVHGIGATGFNRDLVWNPLLDPGVETTGKVTRVLKCGKAQKKKTQKSEEEQQW